MADRYQDRPFPAHDDYGRGDDPHGQKAESDPLAELARLIGQTDPFAMGRANVKAQPQATQRYEAPQPQQYQPQQYEPDQYEPEPEAPAGPPPWMQRANARTQPPPQPQYDDEADYQPAPVHPLHRYGAQQAAPPPQQQAHYQYQDDQYAEEPQADPSRYDDALYGQIEAGQDYQRDSAYPDDPYAYQGAYDDEPQQPRKRGGMITVAAVLALAVLGTGGAFAYRNFIGSPRSGEPPVIKADPNPTRVVPAQADNAPKAPDRMTFGDGNEKIVPREETPVDVNARSGPRVVFPPLNQNVNPPSPASVTPSAPPPATAAANGTLPNNEPRRIRTLSVKGDAADAGMPGGAPGAAARPAPPAQVAAPRTQAPTAPAAAPRSPPTSANASANAPLSLAPGAPAAAAEPPARVAAVNPTAASAAEGGGGNFVVSVASQDSEAAAQEAFRVAQGKYASVLGSRSPLIKRVDMPDGKVKYRATVGPYRTRQEAAQFCSELKAAGGQCFVPN